ncbi:MAG: F0F1 ATP synthase subunit delta [Candidatus Uhrbacteria bacterium]
MRYTASHYARALRAASADIKTFRVILVELAALLDGTARGRTTHPRAAGLLRVLSTHRQLSLLPAIIRVGAPLADREEGIARIAVTSAAPIAASHREDIERTLAEKLNRRIEATYAIDSSCIGGFRFTVNNEQSWDGTIASKIEQLREKLRAVE